MRGSRKFCQMGSIFENVFFFLAFFRDPSTTMSGPSSARQRNAAIIGPPAKRHYMHYMAFRWRADDGATLKDGLVAAIFQGIWTCIARKPYFCDFSGGGPDPLPPPPPLDPPMSSLFENPLQKGRFLARVV